MQQGVHEFHENKTIRFSSKNTNKSVIICGFIGCMYTIIGYPPTVWNINLSQSFIQYYDLGLSSLNIPLHRGH